MIGWSKRIQISRGKSPETTKPHKQVAHRLRTPVSLNLVFLFFKLSIFDSVAFCAFTVFAGLLVQSKCFLAHPEIAHPVQLVEAPGIRSSSPGRFGAESDWGRTLHMFGCGNTRN